MLPFHNSLSGMEDLIDFQSTSIIYQVEKYKFVERKSSGAFTVLFPPDYQLVNDNFWCSRTTSAQLTISSNMTEKQECF
jgi:hypothetical protein